MSEEKIAELEKRIRTLDEAYLLQGERIEKLENDLVYLREGNSNRLQRHEEEISELKDEIHKYAGYIRNAKQDIAEIKSLLKGYFEYRKSWTEIIMKKRQDIYPLDTWLMISLHKISKDILKQLDGEIEKVNEKVVSPEPNGCGSNTISPSDSKPSRNDYVEDYYDPNKEECEHNRPFWECEICGNVRITKEKPSEPSSLKDDLFHYIWTYMGIESDQCHVIIEDLLSIFNKELNKQRAEFLEHYEWCINELYPTHFNNENYKKAQDFYFELKKRADNV